MLLTQLIARAALVLIALAGVARATPQEYFAIHIVDEQTGRGVPLVYLNTTFHAEYVTDSNGYVAFLEPGLMDGRDVWFDIASYGYESPSGAFGSKGMALKPTPGGVAEIKLKRQMIAERLYRLTGYGIYRDTVLLGKTPPIREPLLNAQVTGQDTVQTAIYRNRMLWLWQDTDRVGFTLGCFSMTGATSPLPDNLDPQRGIDFTYFVNKPGEFARAMAQVGGQPAWIDGLTVVKDPAGEEKLLARYAIVNHEMATQEAGLCLYNDAKDVLEKYKPFENRGQGQPTPRGHAIVIRDGQDRYIYYPGNVRVKADFESASDPTKYEGFTCLGDDGQPNRHDGKLVWAWLRRARPIDLGAANDLVRHKRIAAEESPFRVVDALTGKPVNVAGGSVAWNAYLRKWTLLFGQNGGDSYLGELWFSVANSPEGPWMAACKVATHAMPKNNNDCYNPVQHDELQREGGRVIYFSGTFVNTFSGNPAKTPYYDYNNLFYRLDVSDPRLKFSDPPPGLTRETPDQTP